MSTEQGFSILEIIIVIVILGILASFAVIKYEKAVKFSQVEKEAWNVMQFLSTAKPLAMKNDSRSKVVFGSSVCSLFVDTSSSLTGSWKYISRHALSSPVIFGLPSSPPATAPLGTSLPTGSHHAGANWDSCMAVSRNAMGTINSGSVYLSSSRLPAVTYCVRAISSVQSLKMLKWNGSSWDTL